MLVYKFLCGYAFSFLLGIYLRVIVSSYCNLMFNFFRHCQNYIPKQLYHFIFSTAVYTNSSFLHPHQKFVIVFLSIAYILVGVK